MGKETYYITTPIYYVNDVPHVGNAYTTIMSDIIVRYQKLKGKPTWFLTGTDENATKVQEAAKAKNQDVIEYVDELAKQFKRVWSNLGILNDDFIRTTEPRHIDVVKYIFSRLKDQGDIYKGKYSGWYCVPCETFWQDGDVAEGKCPNAECGRQVTWEEEENYYFKLSAYSDQLLNYIEMNPDFLQPEFRKNEVVGFIKQGLRDVSITRRNNGWGIEVPNEPDKVIYVWFDALINYISAIGYQTDSERFNSIWPADLQMMGKDIFVRFHCTFWPAMLMALNLPMPKVLLGHGFWTINGEKISKSKGNAISPAKLAEDLAEESGANSKIAQDAIRYFLAREVTLGLDGDFSIDGLKNRFNSDLANDLGNLINRTLGMLSSYREMKVPDAVGCLTEEIRRCAIAVEAQMDSLALNAALDSIWGLISTANKYIQDSKPWDLNKNKQNDELDVVLVSALEAARAVAIMINPFMPNVSHEMLRQLGLNGTLRWQNILDESPFGKESRLTAPEPIFPRIGSKKDKANSAAQPKHNEKTPEVKQPQADADSDTITYDYFSKMKLKVAEVIEAQKFEGTDKLLKLQVSLGEEKRQVIAGIAKYYKPEDLIGRKIVIIANLAPAKIRGEYSQGMILAAEDESGVFFLTPEKDVKAGSGIK